MLEVGLTDRKSDHHHKMCKDDDGEREKDQKHDEGVGIGETETNILDSPLVSQDILRKNGDFNENSNSMCCGDYPAHQLSLLSV